MTGQRMFVAIKPSEEAIAHLDDFLEPRRSHLRFTRPSSWHITLAFMAQVPAYKEEEMVERLATAAEKRRPVTARLTGSGAFPNAQRAKVLFAKIDTDQEQLQKLAQNIRAAVTKAGVEVDGQTFRPHLTLARLNPPANVVNWLEILDSYRGPAFEVGAFELIASHLHSGQRYETIAEFGM